MKIWKKSLEIQRSKIDIYIKNEIIAYLTKLTKLLQLFEWKVIWVKCHILDSVQTYLGLIVGRVNDLWSKQKWVESTNVLNNNSDG